MNNYMPILQTEKLEAHRDKLVTWKFRSRDQCLQGLMGISSIILNPIHLQEDYSDIPVDSPTPQSYLFRDHLQYMIPLIQGFSRNEESRSRVYEAPFAIKLKKRQSQR